MLALIKLKESFSSRRVAVIRKSSGPGIRSGLQIGGELSRNVGCRMRRGAIFFLISLFFLAGAASCHHATLSKGETFGADEMVLDSYALKERSAAKSALSITVEGAVKRPGVIGSFTAPLSLRDAIAQAGGFRSTADRSRIEIVREAEKKSFSVHWEHIKALSEQSLLLAPGDRVVVRKKPIFELF